MDPKPSIDRAYFLVLQEERQKESRNNMQVIETSAMNAGYKRQKENLTCANCPNMSNHITENCFKVHGYPNSTIPKRPFYGRGGYRGRGGRGSFGARANLVTTEANNKDAAPTLTHDQIQQLLSLAKKTSSNNNNAQPSSSNNPPVTTTVKEPEVNHAGTTYKVNFIFNNIKEPWLLDS